MTARTAGLFIVLMTFVGTAHAQEFGLQVGPPAAAMPGGVEARKPSKDSVFVVRPLGCPEPSTAQLSSSAEGLVDGLRRTVPIQLTPMPTPGVHAVTRVWPETGTWIVVLSGACGGQTAGAIVAMGAGRTYDRNAVTRLSHAPTRGDIDAALGRLAGGVAAQER